GGPGIEANTDLTLAVVQTAGHEVAGVGAEIDLVTVGGGSLDGSDGAGVHPGMPAIERPGPARKQNYAEAHFAPRLTKPKSQNTNHKRIPNPKLQCPKHPGCLVWDLRFGD